MGRKDANKNVHTIFINIFLYKHTYIYIYTYNDYDTPEKPHDLHDLAERRLTFITILIFRGIEALSVNVMKFVNLSASPL